MKAVNTCEVLPSLIREQVHWTMRRGRLHLLLKSNSKNFQYKKNSQGHPLLDLGCGSVYELREDDQDERLNCNKSVL